MVWWNQTENLPSYCCKLCVSCHLLLTWIRNAMTGANTALHRSRLGLVDWNTSREKGTDTKVSSHIAANHGKESA